MLVTNSSSLSLGEGGVVLPLTTDRPFESEKLSSKKMKWKILHDEVPIGYK